MAFTRAEARSVEVTESDARETFGESNIRIYPTTFAATYFAMTELKEKELKSYKLVCRGLGEKAASLHILGVGRSEVLWEYEEGKRFRQLSCHIPFERREHSGVISIEIKEIQFPSNVNACNGVSTLWVRVVRTNLSVALAVVKQY